MTTQTTTSINRIHFDRYAGMSTHALQVQREDFQKQLESFQDKMQDRSNTSFILGFIQTTLETNSSGDYIPPIPLSEVLLNDEGAMVTDADIALAVETQDKELSESFIKIIQSARDNCTKEMGTISPKVVAILFEIKRIDEELSFNQ